MSDKLNQSVTTTTKTGDNTPDPGDCCTVPPPSDPPTT
jgi:hypothetical protein